MSPRQHYLDDLSRRGFIPDPGQERAVLSLQRLFDQLAHGPTPMRSWRDIFRGVQAAPVKGLYLWGGVGRGKTYLVDRFLQALPLAEKRRLHFRCFMQEVHERLRELPRMPDPLPVVAAAMSQNTRVLCLDEFHVDDVADAMLLAGLLGALFAQGKTLLFTSNQAPSQLYPNGLQRERFLPAIALIDGHCEVLQLDSPHDFRRLRAGDLRRDFYPSLALASEAALRAQFEALHGGEAMFDVSLRIHDRALAARAKGRRAAWFDFGVLCAAPRSGADYLVIARDYDVLLLSGIPAMTAEHDDAAARFIELVDALYDQKVRLVATAACELEELYSGRVLRFAFDRTASRLREMFSSSWEHRLALAVGKFAEGTETSGSGFSG